MHRRRHSETGRRKIGKWSKLKLSMHPDTHLVIHLQSLDRRITALEKEVAALLANQKERKKLEGDIQAHEQKISKLRDQMLQAKNNEQYRAFQHEIDFVAKEIRKAEDRILELMAESEPLDQNVKKAEIALKEEKQVVEGEKKVARERTAVDQSQLDVLHGERKEAVAKLKPAVVKEYERIRKKWNGIAVAEVIGGRCDACQIVLRPQYWQDLKRGDELMACESCGRFLFHNPPVHVEDVASVG